MAAHVFIPVCRGVYRLMSLVEGTIVVMDLDRFSELVEKKSWSEYKPNIITGTLTSLIEWFVSKWRAVVVFGLDEERGTEEVVLEIPGVEPEELREDLEHIRRRIEELGASITIVAVKGYVGLKPAKNRRNAYYGTPSRALAHKLLKKAKRRGGNIVVIQ